MSEDFLVYDYLTGVAETFPTARDVAVHLWGKDVERYVAYVVVRDLPNEFSEIQQRLVAAYLGVNKR
jgi:hypothetical protein